MRINIQCFGITRDIIGQRSIDVDMEYPSSVSDLRKLLFLRYPGLERLKTLSVAVNEDYADADPSIRSGDMVVLIPPVSGG